MQSVANWILTIIQLVVTSFSGLVGYVFKKESSRVKALEERVNQIEKDMSDNYVKKCDCNPANTEENLKHLAELELRMSREFVRRKEYNISHGEVMKKLDKIYDILIERK